MKGGSRKRKERERKQQEIIEAFIIAWVVLKAFRVDWAQCQEIHALASSVHAGLSFCVNWFAMH